MARRRNIAPGTEVFLLLQGSQHGLVCHGITTDWPVPGTHYPDPAKTTRHVPLEWNTLLPLARIPRDDLEQEVPGVRWRQIYSSGWPVRMRRSPTCWTPGSGRSGSREGSGRQHQAWHPLPSSCWGAEPGSR